MTSETRTSGEIVFERYLKARALGFEFEKSHPGRRNDRTTPSSGSTKTIILDVKDFDPPDHFSTGFGAFDPYPPIREKINQGRDKFKQFKEYCCGLVLYNAGQPFVMLEEDHVMLGSMYGDSGFTFR